MRALRPLPAVVRPPSRLWLFALLGVGAALVPVPGCRRQSPGLRACRRAARTEMVRVGGAASALFIDRHAVRADALICCVQAGACSRGSALLGPGGACNLGVPERADHPANCIDYRGAEQYCRWLGRRLPTAPEWGRAAGGSARIYPWGDRLVPGRANCDEGVCRDGFAGTAPVTAFAAFAAPCGAVQLAGNVFEWTATWYESPPGTDLDLRAPPRTFRVLRGGSWREHDFSLRNAAFHYLKPDVRSSNVGFRCARTESP